MRVLFATTAGAGHFGPLVPVAAACRARGHDVRVAAPASFARDVARAGFDHAPFDDVPGPVMGAVFAGLEALTRTEAEATVVGHVFARLDAQAALPGVRAAIEQWRPDVVVREPCEFASSAAALAAGVPLAEVSILMGELPATFTDVLRDPLAELDRLVGLPAGTVLDAVHAGLRLTSVPASLDTAGPDGGPARPTHRFRDPSLTRGDGPLPAPWGDPDAPLVYVTFGSVAARMERFAPVFRATLDALADLPVRVLMTTGDAGDPAALGPRPANAHVERWWPQADVMRAAAAVVGHGGFGTTMITLAAGVPQVVVPLFSFDQTINATQVAAAGAGIHLDGGVDAAPAVGGAVARLLDGDGFRHGAAGIAAELAALPDVADAVAVVEAEAAR